MELLLTSFGMTEQDTNSVTDASLFYKMPPVITRATNNVFMPDYAALLLCEKKIVLDKSSFVMLVNEPHWTYAIVAESLLALYNEGFVELVDFRKILKDKRELLDKMLLNDLQSLEVWIPTLRESLSIWHRFTINYIDKMKQLENVQIRAKGSLYYDSRNETNGSAILGGLIHEARMTTSHISIEIELVRALSGKETTIDVRGRLQEIIRSYLTYINANIIISNSLGIGFHDWSDYHPFYKQKFLSVGQEEVGVKSQIESLRSLFTISFPEFEITNTSNLLRLLHDKRIESLRSTIQNAVKYNVSFNEEFARNTLKDVLKIERKVSRYRNITSYLTIPLGFIPGLGPLASTGVQKLAEEMIGKGIENTVSKDYQWFYMLSDAVDEI